MAWNQLHGMKIKSSGPRRQCWSLSCPYCFKNAASLCVICAGPGDACGGHRPCSGVSWAVGVGSKQLEPALGRTVGGSECGFADLWICVCVCVCWGGGRTREIYTHHVGWVRKNQRGELLDEFAPRRALLLLRAGLRDNARPVFLVERRQQQEKLLAVHNRLPVAVRVCACVRVCAACVSVSSPQKWAQVPARNTMAR